MKKALLCIVVLVGLLWAGTGYSGNMCWTIDWGNYLKVYVTKPDGVSPYKTVTGAWYYPGNFVIPVTGTLQKDLGGTALRLFVSGPHKSGEVTLWFLDATLDPTTKNGPIQALSVSGGVLPDTDQGTLTKTPCSELPPY
jgi:hypothetical protein